jgi:hypothetical protein
LPKAREQIVFSLNLKANKIFQTNTKNVFFDKLLGVSEITKDDILGLAKVTYSDKEYQIFLENNKNELDGLVLDFENIWTGLETFMGYPTLMEVVKKRRIETRDEKLELVFFIIAQSMRSPSMVQSMIEMHEMVGKRKFEYYVELKYLLSNNDFLMKVVIPYVFSEWHLYVTEEHAFPLSECPVFINNNSTMVALSPRMLLEINKNSHATEYSWILHDGVPPSKLNEYRNRCIANCFKEIIFSRNETLEDWKSYPGFQERVRLLKNVRGLNAVVAAQGNRELWKINAFSNMKRKRVRRKPNSS